MLFVNGFSILFITFTLAFSVLGIVITEEVYKSVFSISNLNATDTPLTSAPPSVGNIQQCARLCPEKPGCRYLRLYEEICSLFESTPHNTGNLQGPYFTILGDSCPISEGYISVSSPRMCFKASEESDKKTWLDSQSKCQDDGGRLMILNTAARHDYIYQYMVTRFGEFTAFVGMDKVGGVFKWTDDTDYVKQWEPGEPDYVSWQQNCVVLDTVGLFDTECNIPRRYLCEIITTE